MSRRLALLVLLLPTLAAAQEEVCTSPISRIQVGAALGQAESALKAGDIKEYSIQLQLLTERLICLEEVIDKTLLGQISRHLSISYFFNQDEEQARRWAILSKSVAPDLPWDPMFRETHPLRRIYTEVEAQPPILSEGFGLIAPKKGGVFLDGNLTLQPASSPDIPHFVQVFGADNTFVQGYWGAGSRWPSFILEDDDKLESPPKWWEGDVNPVLEVGEETPPPKEDKPEKQPKPPRDKSGKKVAVVPLAIAGSLLVGSGVTYGLAGIASGQMKDQIDPQGLADTRSRANRMVITSTVLFAGALGAGVTGVLISDRSIGITGRF